MIRSENIFLPVSPSTQIISHKKDSRPDWALLHSPALSEGPVDKMAECRQDKDEAEMHCLFLPTESVLVPCYEIVRFFLSPWRYVRPILVLA